MYPNELAIFRVSGQSVTPSVLPLEVINIFRHMVPPALHVLNDTLRANANDELLCQRKNIFWLLMHSQVLRRAELPRDEPWVCHSLAV